MRPQVSIVILNYNGKRFLKGCLDAVFRQRGPPFEVIFVDNASHDGSVQLVRELYAPSISSGALKIVVNAENEGFARGNNLGVARASKSSRYVVLLNNDTAVYPGWLSELIRPLERDPTLAITGSLAYDGKGRNEGLEFFRRGLGGTMSVCGEVVSRPLRPDEKPPVIETFVIGGYSLAYRKSAFRRPFEDCYFAYAEDTYLSWLSRLKGYRNAGVLSSRVNHFCGGTKLSGDLINRIAVFNGTKNQLLNYLLFYEWKNVIRIAPLMAITQLGHIVDDPRKTIVKLKAYFWVLINARMILRLRAGVQRQRKVADRDLLRTMSCRMIGEEYVPSGWRRTAIRLANRAFSLYCFIVGLRTMESFPQDAKVRKKPKRHVSD